MLRHLTRQLPLIVLLGLLTNGLPPASLITPPSASAQSDPSQIEEPIIQPLIVPPVVDPHLPSLTLHLALTPNPVAIGDTIALTLTVTNEALDPAEDLVVALPTPDGALALPGPHTLSPSVGWRWPIGHLDGPGSVDVIGQLRLLRPPSGDALLLHAQATARGLDLPIHEIGGALLTDRSPSTATMRFLPGATARLRSRDRSVQVDLPARAFGRVLNLRHAPTPLAETIPPVGAGFRRGFGIFFLNATDDAGQAIHQFTVPLTLTLRYTPEQLEVLGIAESDLTLTWYNTATQAWQTIPTSVDPATQTATAQIDHFSAFQLSDGSSPSAAFIPSLQGFQVSSFTGAASYSYPIEVPAGPSGLKPDLALSYSSAATDGATGQRRLQQASWVGKGWSLDTGSIAHNKIRISAASTVEYYSVVVNGQSYDLLRGPALVAAPSASRPQDWQWLSTDEQFMRVQVFASAMSDPNTRGGVDPNGVAYPRTTWRIWAKDGTRYDFVEDLWWGFCTIGAQPYLETYKWLLSSVTDIHQNTIAYTYDRAKTTILQDTTGCGHVKGTVDHDAWPTTISWGGNSATGTIARYRVTFASTPRIYDTQFEGAENQFPNWGHAPHETRRLDVIQIESNPAGSWQLVHQYNLGHDYSLLSDVSLGTGCPAGATKCADATTPKLTLASIQRVGNNGTSGLPPTTFTYNTTRGTAYYPSAGWNRLASVNNGQGGTLTLTYANIAEALNNSALISLFYNNWRVTRKRLTDGQGYTYDWTYSYGTPNYNSIGTTLGGKGTVAPPNAATVYLNTKWSAGDNTLWLAHKAHTEFRGHNYVAEIGPTGAQTEHFFYQGDAGCVPTASGGTLATYDSDPCFVEVRRREILKGKEYLTRVRASAGGALLQETVHTFAVQFYDYTATPPSGLWRAFTFESQTDQKQYEGSGTPIGRSTRYCYAIQQQGGVQYGNLTHTRTYAQLITSAQNVVANCDQVGTAPLPVRIDRQDYIILNTAGSYLVDREAQTVSFDNQGRLLALTELFYDDMTTYKGIGTKGDLTLVRAYYDVPLAASTLNVIVHSNDTSHGYDSYGNRITESIYTNVGTRRYNGSSITYSALDTGSTARTTTTTYDSVFHAFPTQVDPPTVNGVTLTEHALYDSRMGTLIKVIGPNGEPTAVNCAQASYTVPANDEVTCAQYDVFGRMVKLVKPGDSTTYPTLLALYYDSEQPFRYRIDRREGSGTANVRVEQQFYDGLGRRIQTKAESANNAQNIVVDTRYDGLGQVTAQSQPRYVAETATTFVQYSNPGSSVLFNQTTTTYDALGRGRVVTAPGSLTTNTTYTLTPGSLGTIAATVDPNGHKTEREADGFGRLRTVREYSGAGSYTLYATTTYAYDPLDQLTTVTDTAGNVTSLSYDSLGRKLTTNDRDMGLWRYSYDANSNLLTQTDAKNQVLWFGYDALHRLTQKRQTNASGTLLAQYTYDAGTYGKGQRTAMSVPSGASSSWVYDTRGRKITATHTVPGLSGIRLFQWSYDSADRLLTQTYPSLSGVTEVLTYGYDAAWRPTQVCTSRGGCYVRGATYTALDQPDQWTLGNSVMQDWSYSSPTQRLQRLKIGSGTPATIFDRSYSYDNRSNITAITDNKTAANTQTFGYDVLDRLTTWTLAGTTQSYTYNAIGNLTSKPGNGAYTYPASGASSVRPHTPSAVNGASYTYDSNGNLTAGGGRTYTWTIDNLPNSISHVSGTETYQYDADGERVKKVAGSVTTVYLAGLWEEVVGGATKVYYPFNRQIVALRDSAAGMSYLHGDHLGSASVVTNASGGVASTQEFDAWGKIRSGRITQTTINFTGQRLDGTGLLYYHARMYDPALGRFVSADSVVPGSASGGMDGIAIKPLTVDFHESGFVGMLNRKNGQPFWFQMSDEQRQKAGNPWGPANPQSLNRYSYVQNNPLRYTDPSGHVPPQPVCLICNLDIDISQWSRPAQGAAIVSCWIVGCEIDYKQARIIGPDKNDWMQSQVAGMGMPFATVIGGTTKAILKDLEVNTIRRYSNRFAVSATGEGGNVWLAKMKDVLGSNIKFLSKQLETYTYGTVPLNLRNEFLDQVARYRAIIYLQQKR